MLALAKGGLELPPRTRRIHYEAALTQTRVGTTSAYAENTHHPNGPQQAT